MNKYALLQNNIVVEIKDFNDEEIIEALSDAKYNQIIDITNDNPTPGIGWMFNGSVIIPPVGVNGKISMIISRLAFRQRLTTTELVGIYVAKANNPVLQLLLDNLMAAEFIDLERVDTYQGTMYLVQQNLLTLARAQSVLTTVPTAFEIYKG